MDHAIDHNVNGSSGHEHREANLKLIVVSAGGLVVVVAIVMVLMWGMFNVLKTDQEHASESARSPMAVRGELPPEPRVEEHPEQELIQLQAYENEVLNGYSWADQKAGIVRIPIDRAIDMVAQKGLPVLQPGQAPAPTKVPAKPVAKPAAGVTNAPQ